MVNFELVGEVKNLLFIFEKGVGQEKKNVHAMNHTQWFVTELKRILGSARPHIVFMCYMGPA